MICRNWIQIASSLVLVYLRYVDDVSSCEESGQTVTVVSSCPKNEEDWKIRADLKQCSQFQQQCVVARDFVYHCVINTYGNETLEVCSPKVKIVDSHCAEYNRRGGVIQRSEYVKCKGTCPPLYDSTDAYKYKDCFKTILAKTSADNLNMSSTSRHSQDDCTYPDSSVWSIVAFVMIAVNVILFIVILWLIYRNWGRKNKENVNKGDRNARIGQESSPRNQEEGSPVELESLIGRQGVLGPEGMNVAAIDIGDRYLTMAISIRSSPEDIQPLGSMERMCFLSYSKNEENKFGQTALKEYTKEEKSLEEHQKFNEIKLSDDGMDDKDYRKALRLIIKSARGALLKEKHRVKIADISYVFVVPNYWKEGAVEKLKSELSRINKPTKNRFCVIKREQTVSHFIHEVKARVICLNFNVDNLVLSPKPKSNTFAILHIGSTHYGLIFSGVKEDPSDEKIPTEEPKTWTYSSNERVLIFLEHIFETETIKRWQKKIYWEYVSFLIHFEKLLKDTDERIADATFDVELSEKLIEMDKEREFEEKIRVKDGLTLGKNKRTLQIELHLLRSFFDDVEEEVRTLLNESWEKFDSRNVKCVVMTGAYSKRKIIWDIAEKDWFKGKKVTIVVPESTHAFAMGGAFYGQNYDWKDALI